MRRAVLKSIFCGMLAVGLAACGVDNTRSSPEEIQRARYHDGGPSYITILSMVDVNRNSSEHTGILINGSRERVLYDPAGNFRVPNGVRADDIHYGVTDNILKYYKSFHARNGFYVESQKVMVTPQVADMAIAAARRQGATAKTQCAVSASLVLRQVPGFGVVEKTLFPQVIRDNVAKIPGVMTDSYYENDEGKNIILPQDELAKTDVMPVAQSVEAVGGEPFVFVPGEPIYAYTPN